MSKAGQKRIRQLHLKKQREEEGLFLVEGAKSVAELLVSGEFDVDSVFITQKFRAMHGPSLQRYHGVIEDVDDSFLEQSGTLQTNDGALAIVKIPPPAQLPNPLHTLICLDDVRDPGNLGTIIRIADWFGISHVVCSPSTVDWYNPKVISASMGSFLRVRPIGVELGIFLASIKGKLPIWGAAMGGENISSVVVPDDVVLVMGNESNGISHVLKPMLDKLVAIPRLGGAESLNVATATAILCYCVKK